MWLLNHSTSRKFEVPMLKKIGFSEIFLPKIVPSYRSASIDYSEDANLSIPAQDLAILNETNWYQAPTLDAINIANQYFELLFFIPGEAFKKIVQLFKGIAVLRVYGQGRDTSYHNIIRHFSGMEGERQIQLAGNRFWLGEVFENIHLNEPSYLSRRAVFLPLPVPEESSFSGWTGSNPSIFFVCPNIVDSPYYTKVFNDFKKHFAHFSYVIGGEQPIKPRDNTNILGYVPKEQHEKNMREMRVMFYHSREPRHLHYHPIEAIQAGMPLVFMSGGVLDQLGGVSLPGRCRTIREAQAKIKRILAGDWSLIQRIRETQPILLRSISKENCEAAWQASFDKIFVEYEKTKQQQIMRPLHTLRKRKKIAVIIPVGYRGGSLRGAKLLAQALYCGSRQYQEPADVVFCHLDDAETYTADAFDDLPLEIQRRPFRWKALSAAEARCAMRYARYDSWEPTADRYLVIDEEITQLSDCDFWLVLSDRLHLPLLPLKPYACMVYDYIQRYVSLFDHAEADFPFLDLVRKAELVLVTTHFTQQDALQYAGVSPSKVAKVPMLIPYFEPLRTFSAPEQDYFLWTTNMAPHKNHQKTLAALRIYYEELDGKFACYVTGVNTTLLSKEKYLTVLGELPELEYQKTLAGAKFLWHTAVIDNGTFSVLEAASMGVPALSSDYPAIREMNEAFSLNLAWMDAHNPRDMAAKIKEMEQTYEARCGLLPSPAIFLSHKVEQLAKQYWKVIRECL